MGMNPAAPIVALDHVSKSYDGASSAGPVIDGLSLEFRAGESYAILGPNGCGKSSLLDLVGGLTSPDAGTVRYAPTAPRFAYVFQNYRESLLPWLSVRENVEWPVRERLGDVGARARFDAILAFVAARFPLEQRVGNLSGGQAQLVALVRAWAFAPDILIADEPFSALDLVARRHLIETMTGFCASENITSITVTHSVEDALQLANHILVVSGPPLTLVGTIHIADTLPRGVEFVGSQAFDEALKTSYALLRSINDPHVARTDR
jgi:NitT/TauT family transport system ATP-binding protein